MHLRYQVLILRAPGFCAHVCTSSAHAVGCVRACARPGAHAYDWVRECAYALVWARLLVSSLQFGR